MYHFEHMSVLKCAFYFALFSVTSYAQWMVDDSGCRTPDRGVGDCIPARQCKPLVDFLMQVPKPISEEVRLELNKYTCGYDSTVKVCCPSSGALAINTLINVPLSNDLLENPPAPPDVSEHKNFNLLPEECGYLRSPDKIRDGNNAMLNEFPWMALLSYTTPIGPQFRCGGSILNDKYILTAAHCLLPSLLGVRVGEYAISTKVDCEVLADQKQRCSELPVQDLAIEEVIVHPNFSKDVIINDIGLIRVTKMNLNVENVRPVCLPTSEETRTSRFNYCVVTGWGFTESFGNSADILQKVDLPVMNLTQCNDIYKGQQQVKVTYKQVCAGGKNNKDSCNGDSGGPMQVAAYINDETRFVQQGIVSFGHRFCGTEGYPGVYTRIAYYMDWILDNIKP